MGPVSIRMHRDIQLGYLDNKQFPLSVCIIVSSDVDSQLTILSRIKPEFLYEIYKLKLVQFFFSSETLTFTFQSHDLWGEESFAT